MRSPRPCFLRPACRSRCCRKRSPHSGSWNTDFHGNPLPLRSALSYPSTQRSCLLSHTISHRQYMRPPWSSGDLSGSRYTHHFARKVPHAHRRNCNPASHSAPVRCKHSGRKGAHFSEAYPPAQAPRSAQEESLSGLWKWCPMPHQSNPVPPQYFSAPGNHPHPQARSSQNHSRLFRHRHHRYPCCLPLSAQQS